MGANGACYICYESQPTPIQSGCACRDEAGFVHIECMVQVAVSQVGHRGNIARWECHTCKQKFTGAMRTGLAEAWWAAPRSEALAARLVGDAAPLVTAEGRWAATWAGRALSSDFLRSLPARGLAGRVSRS
jgi:hypothetical protein